MAKLEELTKDELISELTEALCNLNVCALSKAKVLNKNKELVKHVVVLTQALKAMQANLETERDRVDMLEAENAMLIMKLRRNGIDI